MGYYSRDLIHMRSTIAFDGGAGNGAQGIVVVLTVTGRVLIKDLAAFCTESLVGASATIELGTAFDINELIPQTTATDLDINEWWTGASPIASSAQEEADTKDVLISGNVNITVATADVTDGTIIFDVWYRPITDDGALA